MLHELLATLQGCPGSPFIEENGNIRITKGVTFLHPAEESLMNRICLLGGKYKRIQEFAASHMFNKKGTGVVYGLYASAFATSVDEALEPYRTALWQLELEILADPAISLTHFLHLEQFLPLFQHLLDVIATLEVKKPHGCRILEVIYDACNCGISMVEACMQRILRDCHVVLFRQIRHWMINGVLCDPYEEFFIAPDFETSQMNKETGTQQSCFSKGRNRFKLRPELIPSYIPNLVAVKILFVGESVGILDPYMYESVLKKRIPSSEFRRKEMDYTEKLDTVYQSEQFSVAQFTAAVNEIRACSAEQLWKVVVEDANLLAHLKIVKEFYLLGRGELFLAFIDLANKVLREPITPNLARDANAAFKTAAARTSSRRDKTAEKFRIVAQPKLTSQEKQNPPENKLETGWSAIGLQYEVPFPLHTLFTPFTLERYNNVFKFLLSVRRVQVELHQCWALQMRNKNMGRESRFVSFWQLRSHMEFLIDNLQYYLQVDVLESQFADLVYKVETVKDFEAIQRAHDQFVVSIASQSFLHLKPVYFCLLEILDMCSSFCSLIKRVQKSMGNSEVKNFANIKLNFQRQTSLLFRILCGARSHQVSPHLAQLLLRIDYNKYLSMSGGHLGGAEMKPV